MTTKHEKIEGFDHRVVFTIMALVGGGFASLLLGSALLALMKLDDPASLPPGVMDNPPDELRLLVVVGFAVGGFVALIAGCAALGIFVGPAKTEAYDPRGAPIDPTLLLGEQTTFRRPTRYVAPEDAQRVAVPCGVVLLAVAIASVGSWWVWRLPLFVYLFVGVAVALGAQWLAYVVRVELAARRLRVRFTRAPRQVRPGDPIEVEVELRPQGPLAIDAVQVVLAGLLESEVPVGKTTRVHEVEVLHREVKRLPLDGATTAKARRFRCALKVPDVGAPSGRTSRGSVRWIVAALVDIPDWPDAARVCEVAVKP
jgi:hypothetical protein